MKTKEVELFGEKVLLSELTAEDFFVLKGFGEKNTKPEDWVKANYLCLEMALAGNKKPLPSWWRWQERKKIVARNRLFERDHILKSVGLSEAAELFEEVFRLSGLEFDKKKVVQQADKKLAETLPGELSPIS